MAYKLRAQNPQNVWLIPFFTRKPLTLAQRPDQWFYVHPISNNDQISSSKHKRESTIIQE